MRSPGPVGDAAGRAGQVGGDGAVGEHHALGDAGGAGGVRAARRRPRPGRWRPRGSGAVEASMSSTRAVALAPGRRRRSPDAAREFGGPAGRLQQRRDGDDPAGARSRSSCLANSSAVASGCTVVTAAPGARGPVEDGRVGDRCWGCAGRARRPCAARPRRGAAAMRRWKRVELGVGEGRCRRCRRPARACRRTRRRAPSTASWMGSSTGGTSAYSLRNTRSPAR